MSSSSDLGKSGRRVEKGRWKWGCVLVPEAASETGFPGATTGTSATSPASPKRLAAPVTGKTNSKTDWNLASFSFCLSPPYILRTSQTTRI